MLLVPVGFLVAAVPLGGFFVVFFLGGVLVLFSLLLDDDPDSSREEGSFSSDSSSDSSSEPSSGASLVASSGSGNCAGKVEFVVVTSSCSGLVLCGKVVSTLSGVVGEEIVVGAAVSASGGVVSPRGSSGKNNTQRHSGSRRRLKAVEIFMMETCFLLIVYPT